MATSPEDVYVDAHTDGQSFRTAVSAVRALETLAQGNSTLAVRQAAVVRVLLCSPLSFSSITRGRSASTLQNSHSVSSQRIDKNKPHFPKKTDKSFPN